MFGINKITLKNRRKPFRKYALDTVFVQKWLFNPHLNPSGALSSGEKREKMDP